MHVIVALKAKAMPTLLVPETATPMGVVFLLGGIIEEPRHTPSLMV